MQNRRFEQEEAKALLHPLYHPMDFLEKDKPLPDELKARIAEILANQTPEEREETHKNNL